MSEIHVRLITMAAQIYYNSTGTTPLEEAEINIVFYTQLIVECSYASAENLFPAEQLQQLLVKLNEYRKVVPEILIFKIDANIREYRNLHKKLTNQYFITINKINEDENDGNI